MLLFLWHLFATTAEPGNGLDLPPTDDPIGRLIAMVVAIAVPISAVAVARIQAKKGSSNGPAPIPASDSPTPRLDVSQQYLERYVSGLEKRIELTETKAAECAQLNAELQVKCARLEVRLEAAEADLREANAKVSFLEGQLRGRNG